MTSEPDALRVLHLDHTSAPGGAEYALARMLVARPAWRPLLLTPPTGGEGVFATLRGVVPHRRSGVAQPVGVSASRFSGVVPGALALLTQAVATRCHPGFRTADLVDANSARAAAYGALAAWTSRVPFVVHLRDFVDPEALGRFGHALMTRVVLPRADGVIANSRATLASASPHLRVGVQTAVIPSASGLRPVSAVQAPRQAPLRIGMLARIDPWKGQDLVIRAFAAAFGQGDAVLELAGSAPFGHEGYREELEALAAELQVAHRVRFLGHVEDTAALLAGWDIAVQFSVRPEPLGQNVLQYLAAGRPVVVADEGGPLEWVEDGRNGIVVPARDVDALSTALVRLASDDSLRTELAEAAASTPGLLTDDEVARAHAELYARLVPRGGAQ